jgi:hypothetical protein
MFWAPALVTTGFRTVRIANGANGASRSQLIVLWFSTRDISAGERDVRDTGRGADRLHIKALF